MLGALYPCFSIAAVVQLLSVAMSIEEGMYGRVRMVFSTAGTSKLYMWRVASSVDQVPEVLWLFEVYAPHPWREASVQMVSILKEGTDIFV